MGYPAIPDRHMPYDNDGTVVLEYENNPFIGAAQGYITGANLIALNNFGAIQTAHDLGYKSPMLVWFFPEQREVSAIWYATGVPIGTWALQQLEGSNDSTNGIDGTWEVASFTPPTPYVNAPADSFDRWRSTIKTVSFTGPKQVVRLKLYDVNPVGALNICQVHLYGAKAAGQTPDDILFLDGTIAYAEFTADADFGDRPLGTTSVRTWKVKNASATHTANTINLQCNDADFAISSDGVTYVNTINITSLAAGASSGVLYLRDTSPNPGGAMGPRFARIVATVASYT